jgi:hypothetical protein
MAGARNEWPDMSEFVVHFTKAVTLTGISEPAAPAADGRLTRAELFERLDYEHALDRSGYFPWMEILGGGVLRPGGKPLGAASSVPLIGPNQRAVCFSETPLDMLERIVCTRSAYGLGFRKDTLLEKNGAPIWYLDADGEQARLVNQQIAQRVSKGADPADPFWRLTPLIDHPQEGGPFEWEREWRVVGEMPFDINEVAFLFLPAAEHPVADKFFRDIADENRGPSYRCPYLDPAWKRPRIQKALTRAVTRS